MTINKAQGQTLQRVCVDLIASQCFSHGMFYTAVSRVQSANSLRIMSGLREKAVNVVDPEMIRGADAHLHIEDNPGPPSDPPTDTQRNNSPSHTILQPTDAGEPMDTFSPPPTPTATDVIPPSSSIELMEIDTPHNNNTAANNAIDQGTHPSTKPALQNTNNEGTKKRLWARLQGGPKVPTHYI